MPKSTIEVTAAGTQLAYAVETSAGTMPTTAIHIPNITDIPDFSAAPEMLEVTDLGDTVNKRFIPGLTDLSNASEYTANETELFDEVWDKMVEAYETGKASGLATWFYIITPGLKTTVFTGIPKKLGGSGRAVNNVVKITASITVNSEVKRIDDKITVSEPANE